MLVTDECGYGGVFSGVNNDAGLWRDGIVGQLVIKRCVVESYSAVLVIVGLGGHPFGELIDSNAHPGCGVPIIR